MMREEEGERGKGRDPPQGWGCPRTGAGDLGGAEPRGQPAESRERGAQGSGQLKDGCRPPDLLQGAILQVLLLQPAGGKQAGGSQRRRLEGFGGGGGAELRRTHRSLRAAFRPGALPELLLAASPPGGTQVQQCQRAGGCLA